MMGIITFLVLLKSDYGRIEILGIYVQNDYGEDWLKSDYGRIEMLSHR